MKILTGYPNCTFHVDATQAVGKIPFSCADADLVSFAPHKFYGLGSSGILYKKQPVILEPLIHGGASTTIYRSGTPDTAMILAMECALELGLLNLSEHFAQIQKKNQYLQEQLAAYPPVPINSLTQQRFSMC
ncbi:MAG: aminotransferase class V-fold PLP-dependent enzyme [Ruminococcus sp.]